MKNAKHIMCIAACVALCVFALVACGCSQSTVSAQSAPAESSKSQGSSAAASAPSSAVSKAATVKVTNATGADVVAVRVKEAGSGDFSEENSFYDLSFADGETMDLAFTGIPGASAYDVVLITSDDAKIGVKNIDLLGAQDITFRFEEGLGYITYTDPQSGEKKDTSDAAASSEENSQDVPSDLESQKG